MDHWASCPGELHLWILSHVTVWMEGRHVERKKTFKNAAGKMIGFLVFVV